MNKFLHTFLCILTVLCLLPAFSLAEEAQDPFALPLDMDYDPPKARGEFTATTYHDESLDVVIEEIRYGRNTYHLAHITVASPTQLRTVEVGKPNQDAEEKPSLVGRKKNAVLMINGEFYTQRTKDAFIYRQGVMYQNNPDPQKDILIIDSNGDFHVFLGADQESAIHDFIENGGDIVNAFSFGPAFAADGMTLPFDEERDNFYPNLFTQRTMICQEETREDGRKSYCFIYADKATHEDLHSFVAHVNESNEYGFRFICAYNLDGGKSSILLFNKKVIGDHSDNKERPVKDMIYVATAVSE
ncbi:MAG: hypothetical protein CW338_05145 [Clostridiales bacterium]|nr:hypothetical protein [Clostridiales bacterium]